MKRNHTAPVVYGHFAMKLVSAQVIAVMTLLAHLLVLWVSSRPVFFPEHEQLMSVLGTNSEIIAGLYGITLAGYTFFLSRIDGLAASDATLDYVTESIKTRFKYLIWYITFNVLITLIFSIFLTYYPAPTGEEWSFLYRLICNEFMLFAVSSIALIIYYSVRVTDPNCIRKEAKNLKRKLEGRRTTPGNAAEFLMLYDRIETRCNAMIPEAVLAQLRENKGAHFELTLGLLEEQRYLPGPVLWELMRLHRYYECVVNCATLSVSKEMCVMAENLLRFLETNEVRLTAKT